MSVYDDLKAGGDAFEQIRKSIPATQFIDLENSQCVGRFGTASDINIWSGVVERDDDTEKQYLALNNGHTTVMLLNSDEVESMIDVLKDAREDFFESNKNFKSGRGEQE